MRVPLFLLVGILLPAAWPAAAAATAADASATALAPSSESSPALDFVGRPAVTTRRCGLRVRKPSYPTKRGASNEIVLRDCRPGPLESADRRMRRGRSVTLFLECGRRRTIRVRKTLALPGQGDYKIVNRGGGPVVLHGTGRTQIIQMKSYGKLAVYGIEFRGGWTESEFGGGAIQTKRGSDLTVIDCTFRNNASQSPIARGGGGAIKRTFGYLIIWNSLFAGNHGPKGGAVGMTGGNLLIYYSRFVRNYTTGARRGNIIGNGGAVRCDGVKEVAARCCGCEFPGNDIRAGVRARYNGGTFSVWGRRKGEDLAQLYNSVFDGNGSKRSSARNICMLQGSGRVTVMRTVFRNNIWEAGTLRLAPAKSGFVLNVQDVTMINNRDNSKDGIRHRRISKCSIRNSFFNGVRIQCSGRK